MKSFHNNEKIKQKYIDRVIAHRKADNIVKGETGEDDKGCAVSCTLDMVYDHKRYPIELGIPEWLAHLEDDIFEGLPVEDSKSWPEEFLKAIPVGVDLEQIRKPFNLFILNQNLKYLDSCKYDEKENPKVKEVLDKSRSAIKEVIRCIENNLDLSAARGTAKSAYSAVSAAYSAFYYSAVSAAYSAFYYSAVSAAYSAFYYAAYSAFYYAAESTAYSAAFSAAESTAFYSAQSAANSSAGTPSRHINRPLYAAYKTYADKLLTLLRECR